MGKTCHDYCEYYSSSFPLFCWLLGRYGPTYVKLITYDEISKNVEGMYDDTNSSLMIFYLFPMYVIITYICQKIYRKLLTYEGSYNMFVQMWASAKLISYDVGISRCTLGTCWNSNSKKKVRCISRRLWYEKNPYRSVHYPPNPQSERS